MPLDCPYSASRELPYIIQGAPLSASLHPPVCPPSALYSALWKYYLSTPLHPPVVPVTVHSRTTMLIPL